MTVLSTLPIDSIHHRRDARRRDDDDLSALADSIAEVGLLSPIRVRRMGDDVYEVVAGSHRLQAAELLGWREIPAIVADDDDLHAELAMIDENLVRAELSPSERATQTARRKAIYLELHPQTAHGENQHTRGEENFSTPSFAGDTAAKTGQTDRTVRLHAERGEKIVPEALGEIRGTPLDRGVYLDRLKRVEPEHQVETVRRDLQQPRQGGIVSRYAHQSVLHSTVEQDVSATFTRFVKLVDDVEALSVDAIVRGAQATNAGRAQLSTRATGLADLMDQIRGRLDR